MTENNLKTNHYIFNMETTKIELCFDKADYDALPDELRRELKSAFLWSNLRKCWVSRAKEPNLYHAKQTAQKLGFSEELREGERLSYAEQLKRQSERAGERADRYDEYAANAEKRSGQLQKGLESHRGDTAFFTQPNINSSSGRAFTNYRERLYVRYEKGFDEYRKSDYFREKAETARETASQAKFEDPAYLDRRIKECRKEIRGREKDIIHYEEILLAIENGEERHKRYGGEIITAEEASSWLQRELELAEKAMDKQGYLENCLDKLGGIRFNKNNIKVGYIVRIKRFNEAEIISVGPVNVGCKILSGGSAGITLTAAYAEITEVVRAKEKERAPHPFAVGEQFEAVQRDYTDGLHNVKETKVLFEIVKASGVTIQLKAVGADAKPITRKPAKTYGGQWRFSIDDTRGNTFYKTADCDTRGESGRGIL